MPNHTYKVERSGQVSIQNEARLKPYWASPDAVREAPLLLEPRRQTATRGPQRHKPEYEVVASRDRDLVRDKQPSPLPEVSPPPPASAPVPSLPKSDPGPAVGTPVAEEGFIPKDGGDTRPGSPAPAATPVELTSPAVEARLFLERSQDSRQPPAYLQDFVCDCVPNGRSANQAVGSAESCPTQHGSCALSRKSDLQGQSSRQD